jgi:hypothetical protein
MMYTVYLKKKSFMIRALHNHPLIIVVRKICDCRERPLSGSDFFGLVNLSVLQISVFRYGLLMRN